MPQIEFRAAGLPDAAVVAQLVNRAYRPTPGSGGWTHESGLVDGHRITAKSVEEIVLAPGSAVLLAQDAGETVGCVHVTKEGHTAHIGMLAVQPRCQNQGLGRCILEAAEAYAAERFAAEKFVMAVLSPRVELIAFYRRRGYQECGLSDYPYEAGVGVPREAVKVVLLEKSVSDSEFRLHIAGEAS